MLLVHPREPAPPVTAPAELCVVVSFVEVASSMCLPRAPWVARCSVEGYGLLVGCVLLHELPTQVRRSIGFWVSTRRPCIGALWAHKETIRVVVELLCSGQKVVSNDQPLLIAMPQCTVFALLPNPWVRAGVKVSREDDGRSVLHRFPLQPAKMVGIEKSVGERTRKDGGRGCDLG